MTGRTEEPRLDTAKSTTGLQPAGAIGFVAALHAQLLLLHRNERLRVLIVAAGIGVVLSVAAEVALTRLSENIESGFLLFAVHGWIGVIAAAWGIAVWWQEPPAHREHVLAAPADVTLQELARITAGGLWLLALLVLATAAALVVQVAGGRAAQLGIVTPGAWAALFSGPLLAYVLSATVATVATATRRSIELVVAGTLVIGAVFAFAFGWAMRTAMVGGGSHTTVLEMLRYSLFNAVGGLGNTTTTYTTHVSDIQTRTVTARLYGESMQPYWLEASIIWWTIAVALLVFALWRRRMA